MVLLNFTKMSGTGNIMLIIDCTDNPHNDMDFHELAKCVLHKNSLSGDQMLVVRSSKIADYYMQIFNVDGSEVEMCGNGVRCFAKYLYDNPKTSKLEYNVETKSGVVLAVVNPNHPNNDEHTTYISVKMGSPKIYDDITINLPSVNKEYSGQVISMGNPHYVIKLSDESELSDGLVHGIGPLLETHPSFPNRTNVEFVAIKG
eukprot:TRINITY_DN3369_c0_g1_i3.p1 TRINITY_DN3369_c0_g1~~TRINITY_DN3369_c0_g1_i3.p1  ORF type:complete len:202 (+),score=16.34 TRINITY_DN3369_c0_g1_i3:8-613(+)